MNIELNKQQTSLVSQILRNSRGRMSSFVNECVLDEVLDKLDPVEYSIGDRFIVRFGGPNGREIPAMLAAGSPCTVNMINMEDGGMLGHATRVESTWRITRGEFVGIMGKYNGVAEKI